MLATKNFFQLESIHQRMSDPSVTDLCFNGPDDIYQDRGQGMESVSEIRFESQEGYRQWVFHLLQQGQKTWDAKRPFLDFALEDLYRVHVLFPPATPTFPKVSIRKHPHAPGSVDAARIIATNRWSNSPEFQFLREAVELKQTILICGSTGSGKTTLLRDLLCFVSEKERVLALEDTQEISSPHRNFIHLLGRPENADGFGEISLRILLKQALRMRPDRILLGECRGEEVLDLLQILNTGHQGTLATIHANSVRDAIRRLELLTHLGSKGSLNSSLVKDLIAGGIRYIVHVRRTVAGLREISEIGEIGGKEGDQVLMRRVSIKST
jgi:pilus assembly protein CpaF